MKAFCCWSGGKDSAFSFYKAIQDWDIKVVYFLNMISEDGKRSRTHGISSELLRLQAKTIGLPIIQRRTTWKTYEKKFKKVVLEFKKKGINTGIFGDIDLQAHRDWVERVCKECGIKPLFPLWQGARKEVLQEFIYSGFKAVVVAVKADVLGSMWVGREIDEEFIEELRKLDNVDLCGEAGEYHTFVLSGPIFKKRIKILKTEKIQRDKSWFLNILKYEVTN